MDRFLFADDFTPEQTWLLLHWCAQHGATEFTVDRLGLQGHAAPHVDRFELDMAPFRLESQRRPRMSAATREELVRQSDLWRLSNHSIAILQEYFPAGLFIYPTSEWEQGCLEGPTFYRQGQIVLGITTHEREGILTLQAAEHTEIARLGISTRERPQWL